MFLLISIFKCVFVRSQRLNPPHMSSANSVAADRLDYKERLDRSQRTSKENMMIHPGNLT